MSKAATAGVLAIQPPPLAAGGDGGARFHVDVYDTVSDIADLLVRKQADYGPHAVRQSPGGPELGVLVRAHDKVQRIYNLLTNDLAPNHESVRDSWVDLAGYAVIGLMLLDGTWPK